MEPKVSTRKVKNILYRDIPWTPKSTENLQGELESQYLLKYFPKYYKKLSLFGIKEPIISRLKRVKRIHAFQFSSTHHKPWDVLSLVCGNKMRDIQVLPEFSHNTSRTCWFNGRNLTEREYVLATLRKMKLCSKLQKLAIKNVFYKHNISPSEVPIFLDRAQHYLNSFRNLKYCEITISDNCDTSPSLIAKLNSLERLLVSLKTLKITFASSFDQPFVQQILEMTTFWKYVSHLTLRNEEPSTETTLQNLILVLSLCENLSLLRMKLPPSKTQPNIYAAFFTCLHHRQNLEALSLSFEYLENDDLSRCLQAFSLPSSIKDIDLTFKTRVITSLIQSSFKPLGLNNDLSQWKATTSKLYEGSRACQNFYKTWKYQILHLDSLSLSFTGWQQYSDKFKHLTEDYALIEICFMAPLLRNISKLTSFKYSRVYFLENNLKSRLNISLLLDMIYHLRVTLKKLELSPYEWCSNFADFHPDQLKSFSNLSLFQLGNLSLDNIVQIEKILRIVPEGCIQSKNNYHIHLSQIYTTSNESFRQLLRCLTKVQKIRNLRATIEVNIMSTDQIQAFEDFCKFVEKSVKFDEVSLSLITYDVFDDDLKKRLSLQQIFKELHIQAPDQISYRNTKMRNGKCVTDYL